MTRRQSLEELEAEETENRRQEALAYQRAESNWWGDDMRMFRKAIERLEDRIAKLEGKPL